MNINESNAVIDHGGDLSSSNKTVLFLGFLFLETDLLLDVGILDDLVQSRSNSRVQHLEIGEIVACSCSQGFFFHPPTWKWWWCGDSVERDLRYLSSLLSCHRIQWNCHWQKKDFMVDDLPTNVSQHWNCAPNSFFTSCNRCSCTNMHWNRTCSTWCRTVNNSWIRCLWGLKHGTWIATKVFPWSKQIQCVKR